MLATQLWNVFKQTSIRKLLRRQYANQAVSHLLQLPATEVCNEPVSRALVLGVYLDPTNVYDTGYLTPSGWRYNTVKCNGRMHEVLKLSGPIPRRGDVRVLFCVEPEKVPNYIAVAVIGLGPECLGYDSYEIIDERKEAIRRGVALACRKLQELGMDRISIDTCGHAESAAEGAALGIWTYQELKDPKKRIENPTIEVYTHKDEVCDLEGWRIGLQKAQAQNFARQMQETPSNYMTPNSFAEKVVETLCRSGVNVEVKVEGWAESQQMNAFLAVGRASCEPPIFLELTYYGGHKNDNPIVLIGQGVTYDSGGLCLKDDCELQHMRADMTGAAVVVATCKAISSLRLPVNLRALVPLCENVMGCNAFRPGDCYRFRNGKTIFVESTDHEDVLVLADALLYAQNFCPKFVVDVGTTSGCMRHALDEAACGVFTNSEILWQQIKNASIHTGDRVWRFPLWNYYSDQVTDTLVTDVMNEGKGHGGNPCKSAAILREFVHCGQWMHIDATNVMYSAGKDYEFLREGFTGRPTRTLIEFIAQTMCKENAPKIK